MNFCACDFNESVGSIEGVTYFKVGRACNLTAEYYFKTILEDLTMCNSKEWLPTPVGKIKELGFSAHDTIAGVIVAQPDRRCPEHSGITQNLLVSGVG
jgi:hypothetical protein